MVDRIGAARVLAAGRADPETVERVQKAATALAGYFNELIARRRGEERDDLLTRLANIEALKVISRTSVRTSGKRSTSHPPPRVRGAW